MADAARIRDRLHLLRLEWYGVPMAQAALTLDPSDGELRSESDHLAAILRSPEHRAKLVGPGGQEIDLPPAIFEALAAIAEALRDGNGVSVIPLPHLLTTSEAANLLNISRPYLVRMLDQGKIPFDRVGTHRRLRLGDVLAHRYQREEQRRDALGNLVRQAEELGLPY
jgi:excisionase family DNA binding protein